MKKICAAALMFFALWSLMGQISMNLSTSHSVFMLYDAAYVRLKLHNYSSHPIFFGNSRKLKGTLEFHILDKYNLPVRPLKDYRERPIIENIILSPGERRTLTVNLLRYYPLHEPGAYQVKAVIRHPQLPASYESNTVPLVIRTGQLMWEHKFGLPDYVGKNKGGKIQQRYYRMYRFSSGKLVSFYLVLEDDMLIYTVRRVGFDMGPELYPQHVVDSMGRLHLMVAASNKVFAYYLFSYDGTIEDRKVYIRTGTTPFLVASPADSSVVVDGGRLARKDIDYKEIKDLPIMDDAASNSEEEQAFSEPVPERKGKQTLRGRGTVQTSGKENR